MDKIIDLKTNKSYSIFSKHGKNLLKMYVKNIRKHNFNGGVIKLGTLNYNGEYEFTNDVITLEQLIAEPNEEQKIIVKNSEGHYYFWTSIKDNLQVNTRDPNTRNNMSWIKSVPFNFLKIWENNNRPILDDISDDLLGPSLWNSNSGFDEQEENNIQNQKEIFNNEKQQFYEQQNIKKKKKKKQKRRPLVHLVNAIETVQEAIKADNEENYKLALQKYDEALEKFIVALKYEKNETRKRLITMRVVGYMERAEIISTFLKKKRKKSKKKN